MSPDRLRFQEFVFETDSGELARRGEPVALQPQPAKVLESLARSSGQVVSREQLYDMLWDDERYVDRDLGLNQCIRQVRKALGDNALEPRFVETVPRRGYRFLVPVELEAKPAAVLEEAPPPRGRRIGWPWAVAAAALAIVLWVTAGPAAAPDELPERLAVLPVRNLTGDSAHDALGRRLRETLASRSAAAHAGPLEVAAASPERVLADESLSVSELGRRAGARLLLKTCFLETHDTLQATVQLIDAESETLVWSHEQVLDPSAWDVWADDVVRSLARRLDVPVRVGWDGTSRRPAPYRAADVDPVPAALRP